MRADFENDVARTKFVTAFLNRNRRKNPEVCAYMQVVESLIVELRFAAKLRPKSRDRDRNTYMREYMRRRRERMKRDAAILKEMGQ